MSKIKIILKAFFIVVAVSLIFGFSIFASACQLDEFINSLLSVIQDPNQNPNDEPVIEGEQEDIISADLSIHFLELGNVYTGDCTLIKVGDTEVLIDAGSRKDSAAYLKSYIDTYCSDGVLEYVIATHADQDHISAFVGNVSGNTRTGLLYQYDVETLIQFPKTGKSTQIYNDYCTAVSYIQNKGANVYTALQCWNNEDGASRKIYLNDEKTVSMNILYNYYYENATSDENDYSVCMLLTQELEDGAKNYLFTGDLEEKGENYLVQNNQLPEVELFKGGHHGSKTSSTEALLSVIKPKYVAVCCCAGSTEYTTNDNNTFPTQDMINRVSAYTDKIYCTSLCVDYANREFTSMNGNIVFYYGKTEEEQADSLKLWCSNNTTVLKDTDWFKEHRTWNG